MTDDLHKLLRFLRTGTNAADQIPEDRQSYAVAAAEQVKCLLAEAVAGMECLAALYPEPGAFSLEAKRIADTADLLEADMNDVIAALTSDERRAA